MDVEHITKLLLEIGFKIVKMVIFCTLYQGKVVAFPFKGQSQTDSTGRLWYNFGEIVVYIFRDRYKIKRDECIISMFSGENNEKLSNE